MIFNRGLAITRKLGFPDVIMPGRPHFLGPGWERGWKDRVLCSSHEQTVNYAVAVKSLCIPNQVADYSLESGTPLLASLPEASTSYSPT